MSKNRRHIDWEEFWFGATLFVMALAFLVAPWVVTIVRGH